MGFVFIIRQGIWSLLSIMLPNIITKWLSQIGNYMWTYISSFSQEPYILFKDIDAVD